MNVYTRHITAKEITEMADAVIMHSSGAKIMLDEGEDYLNMALYHLSAAVRIMLIFICIKYKVSYTNKDAIDRLLEKTHKFLPEEISEKAGDICHWNNDLQYKAESIKTADEVTNIGRTIQAFYNGHVIPLVTEILHETETVRDESLMKF